jgi:hypothetical protein
MRIYVTWPTPFEPWLERRHHGGNYQQAFHYFHGLQAAFHPDVPVIWNSWNIPIADVASGDWLISHPAFDIAGADNRNVVRSVLERGVKVGYITNDCLYSYPWTVGYYDRHGYRGFDNCGLNRCDPDPDGTNAFCKAQCVEYAQAQFVLSHANRRAIHLWQHDDPSIALKKTILANAGVNFTPVIAPTDKAALPREVFNSRRKKFLVYSGEHHLKQQQQFKRLCPNETLEMGSVNWFHPATYKHVIDTSSFAVSCSLQEAEPYFGLECMSKGLLLVGGEDWYQAPEELTWRHAADGSTDKSNWEKIMFLCSDDPRVEEIYNDQMDRFHQDSANTWPCFISILKEKILSSR